jgi:hypothetical protein
MRALEDRTYEEISEALDIPVPVARLWYCRARKRFRSAFVTMMVARRNVPTVCQEMGEAIAELIEGTLPTGDRPRVEQHLGGCHVCRQTEDELRNTAFRAPARGVIIGLGLLRLGWKLPQRIRHGAAQVPHSIGRLALTGVGGVAVATAVVAGSPIIATPAHANSTGSSGHLQFVTLRQGHGTEMVLVADTLRAASVVNTPQGLTGMPDLTAIDNIALVIQRLDDLNPGMLHLGGLRLGPQTVAELQRQADAAKTTASGTVDDLAAQQQRAQQKAQQEREQQQKAQQAHQPQPAWPGGSPPSGNAAPSSQPPTNGHPAPDGNAAATKGQPAPGGKAAPSGGAAPSAPNGAPAPANGSSQQQSGGNQSGQGGGNPSPTLK